MIKKSHIIIYDMFGKNVYYSNINISPKIINVDNLEKGIYFIHVISDKKVYTEKIILYK